MTNIADRTFECPKCKQTWIETDKKIIKCYCPFCNLIMQEIKINDRIKKKEVKTKCQH